MLQPFFLTYAPDDLHIMAMLDGHPAYEAVEAMIRRRADGSWAIRAIVTRHDQTQVDHINDDALAAEMGGADRESVRGEIALALTRAPARSRAVLAFTSFAGEAIVLDITSAGPPVAEGAGLTDPGDHSLRATLPMMWRGKSALAGPDTHVTVDGRRFAAPFRLARGPFVAHEGYFTEGFAMGAVRAGAIVQTMIAAPERPTPGAEWVFEREGRRAIWRAASEGARLRIACEAQAVLARPLGEGLSLEEIRVGGADGLRLAFDGDAFAFDMAGQTALVTGTVRQERGAIVLDPREPAWARSRPVRVEMHRDGDTVRCETSIGR